MVSLDDAVIAHLDSHGERFEILIDPEVFDLVRKDEIDNITEYMAIEEIFKDAHKGDRASRETLLEVFGTENVKEIALILVTKGEIQLTTEQRKKMLEEKKKKIINYISRNAINPQTKTPHPPKRVELAMDDAKVRVDPFKPIDQQINDIVKELQPLLPIKFEKVTIAVKLKASDYGNLYGDLRNMGKMTKEEWQKDGSWIGLVELPAGMQNELLDLVNSRTKGEAEIKVINQ